jgi:Protein of unknown function (DUF2934)
MPIKIQIGPEERARLIAEAAYFRAKQRSFKGGDPVEDWLAAEREIDAKYSCAEHSRLSQAKFYEHLAEETCSRELERTLENTLPVGEWLDNDPSGRHESTVVLEEAPRPRWAPARKG